ncbi:MAG: esterase-like activity of phytase family protein [Bdellovibrionales bacterium]|nr:esterase-like activity of phytase family protein [Bdellovibrionales bacterium]
MKSLSLVCLLALFASSCASSPKKSLSDEPKAPKAYAFKSKLFKMIHTPIVGTTVSGQTIKLGGFSGLQYANEKEDAYFFHTVTDRGPNSEPSGTDRAFLLPEYSPTVVILKADLTNMELSVSAEFKLKKKEGTPLTGLPNTRLEENPTDVFGLYYSVDPQGLDVEGLVFDGEGGWWVADEYGPSLAHFNQEGVMLKRLVPNTNLPRMYADRRPNRGFEAVARVENKLYGFLQSPLSKEETFARIAEIDLDTTKTSAEYFYNFEKGDEKIGDAVAINANTFLVLEQNGKTGDSSQKYIYRIKIGESDRPVEKTLVADLKNTPFNNFEKIEGLTIIDSKKLALIYDNDFQVNGKTNQTTGLTPLDESVNQLMILEFEEELFL